MWARLRAMAETAGRIHPFIYGLIYLSAIPLFAGIYDVMPGDFYAPYVRFEHRARSDAYDVGIMIQRVLRTATLKRSQQGPVAVDRYEIRQPDLLYVQRLTSIDGSRISFDVYVMVWDSVRQGNIQIPISVTIDHASKLIVGQRPGSNDVPYRYFRFVELDNAARAPLEIQDIVNAGFKAVFRPADPVLSPEAPLIELSDEQERQISRFFDGLSGNATSISGSYGRMFYFSAMAITTVGFGDIVPMTPLSRAIVTCEAIFGVVILGLFLNAIAFQASRHAQAPRAATSIK